MRSRQNGRRLLGIIAIVIWASYGFTAQAQTMLEQSLETRFQLDLHVPETPLLDYLPAGWVLNVATKGNAKDANLRVIFVDRMTIHDPDGKPIGAKGSNRLVYLAVPIKDATGTSAQLVIGGLSEDASEAPGPFGNYLAAQTHEMKRTSSTINGSVKESQDWRFAAASGEHLEMHIQYEKGVGNRNKPTDIKFYSAQAPAYYQIWRQEQVLDILRNATTHPPDRVKDFSFKAGGGRYAKLFDGTEKVLSWDNIIWMQRSVFLP